MNCKWPIYTVQQLVDLGMIEPPMDGNHGAIHPKASDYVSEGIPFIMANDLANGKINYHSCAFITEAQAATLRKGFAKPGDVLLTHKATVGRTAIVSNEYDTIILTPQVTYYRVIKGLNRRYLKYYFDTNIFQQLFSNWADAGSTRAYLGITAQRKLPIIVPPIEIQNAIAAICGSLDDKIELNNRINENLERQAQAIYKSWFVDFEPFGGVVPVDWREYTLSEFLPVITGKKNANISSDKGKYPFFSCSQDFSWTDEYSFEGNAILVAGNGDFNVKWYNGKFEAYQRTYVLMPYNPQLTSWLYYAVKYHLAKITSAARGSVIKFITKGNLENFSFYAPLSLEKLEIIDTFDCINQAIDCYTQENYRLIYLRNILLSKIMAGKIDVEDVRF